MAIEVKKISELPEATSVQGDELLEMVQDGKNVKIQADELVGNKVDKVTGKQLSDQNFTQAEKNKLYSLPDGDTLFEVVENKVDKVAGKGLIEPAPNDGKQYVRRNNAWVEVVDGLRTHLDGTALYMTSDGSDPDPTPAPEPDYITFSYEFEVGQDIDPSGGYEYYGVNENYSMGAFINKTENDKIGKLVVLEWGDNQEFGYIISGVSKYSGYLLSYNSNLVLNIRDHNGDILSISITPEDIFEMESGDVSFGADLTEEQYNLLPKSGIVFLEIVLADESDTDVDLVSYEVEVGMNEGSSGTVYYGADDYSSNPVGSLTNTHKNRKMGDLRIFQWADTQSGYVIGGNFENSGLLTYGNDIEVIVRDHDGVILSVTVPSGHLYNPMGGQEGWDGFVRFDAEISESQFNLLPKNGVIFVDIFLVPTDSIQPT